MMYDKIIRKARAVSLRALLALSCLLLMPASFADASRSLQSVDFTSLDGERVLVTLTLSEPAPQPVVFTIDKPARLSLDLPDTHLDLAERFRKIGIGGAVSFAAAEAKDRTRVVIEMTDLISSSRAYEANVTAMQTTKTMISRVMDLLK